MTRAIGVVGGLVLLLGATIAQSSRALDSGYGWPSVQFLAPPVVAILVVAGSFATLFVLSRIRAARAARYAAGPGRKLVSSGETRGFDDASARRSSALVWDSGASNLLLIDLKDGREWMHIELISLVDVATLVQDTATYWGADVRFTNRENQELTFSIDGWQWMSKRQIARRLRECMGTIEDMGFVLQRDGAGAPTGHWTAQR